MSEDQERAAREASREWWESRWAARLSRRPVTRPVHAQIRVACEQRWFLRGARLLDIGCGNGTTSAWLAGCGFRVTAIDFSRTAIESGRRAYAGQPGLTFAAHDISSGPAPGGPFDGLLDWGCLHSVPDTRREAYARNLVAVSEDDARLLLFHAVRPGAEAGVVGAVQDLLRGKFELVSVQASVSRAPGVALRFRRGAG
jgi:2-polyprenyl-3-methyl-5-hydroxy-6-metoxy-1,4-benzoquinol methylase